MQGFGSPVTLLHKPSTVCTYHETRKADSLVHVPCPCHSSSLPFVTVIPLHHLIPPSSPFIHPSPHHLTPPLLLPQHPPSSQNQIQPPKPAGTKQETCLQNPHRIGGLTQKLRMLVLCCISGSGGGWGEKLVDRSDRLYLAIPAVVTHWIVGVKARLGLRLVMMDDTVGC